MKKLIALLLMALVWSIPVLAAGTQYQMRVDGLACPYCAYGIEKKLKKIEGVEKIDVDLNKGLVIVKVADGVKLTEKQMTQLFKDAGFTYRSMTEKAL
ncbi:MAG TPA: copper chaperone [Acidiferrobacteraceae bacterium]|nr:copper chaperone [Acidiferrobacteraceae bacterium]